MYVQGAITAPVLGELNLCHVQQGTTVLKDPSETTRFRVPLDSTVMQPILGYGGLSSANLVQWATTVAWQKPILSRVCQGVTAIIS